MFQNGHFTTISGHYFANYMKIIISKILLKLAEFKKHAYKTWTVQTFTIQHTDINL